MKELFGTLLDDLKKYKTVIIVIFVVCVVMGVIIGLIRERDINEYERIEMNKRNNPIDEYEDNYENYDKKIENDDLIDSGVEDNLIEEESNTTNNN